MAKTRDEFLALPEVDMFAYDSVIIDTMEKARVYNLPLGTTVLIPRATLCNAMPFASDDILFCEDDNGVGWIAHGDGRRRL